ncbi:MAG: spermidine synthase, partial [Bryobacteraceae bacterium]
MILYAATIFLSAFLLFQIQPIIARAILPWFGGSAAVWTTCMLFFQMALLLGYLYADLTIRRLAPRAQAVLHSLVLAASLLVLPILPSPDWKPSGTENPILRILLVLALSVGLPYFLLSTTSPLLQAWYTRARTGAMPYRFFALSNLGSMLALLSYPFLVEPRLTTSVQSTVWSSTYALFAVLCSVTAWLGARRSPALPVTLAEEEAPQPPRPSTLAMWTLLAACPSALLLALTNHLTQDVAAIPFLWILPLSVYLFTFILCFDAPRWYWRPGFLTVLPAVLVLLTWMQGAEMDDIRKGIDTILPLDLNPLKVGITLFAISFFVCAMVCHGELARRKPHPRYLTRFYLMIAIGGALGGVFVGVIAPYAFPSFFEFPIAVGLCGTLAVLAVFEDPGKAAKWYWRLSAAGAAVLGLGVLYLYLGRA